MLGILWITPIVDRTNADIGYAKSYVKNHFGVSGAMESQKGCLNVEDLNRIENDMAFLANILGLTIMTIEWDENTIPTISDKTRLLQNASAILSAASAYIGSLTPPVVPTELTHFTHFNRLERVLEFVYGIVLEPLYTIQNEMLDVGGDYLVVKRVIQDG